MNGFPAKFMLVIAALVLLLMGEFQATCAFLRAEADQGIVKSTLSHVDCTRDGLRKINTGRKEVPIRRNLRPLKGPKPPSPTKNFPPHFRRPDLPLPPSPPPPSFNDTYSPES
ncbi:circumsporozoite protein-like isoform X2 [Prunus persica]|uniref:circumsporozoite protein-like isoform X2 n=1 Tax=Prunus persica TaxID=3760 RepID=UPI0009AB3F7D|nr:circumsporozoite protein-like isoform X2 [Prunus persica]